MKNKAYIIASWILVLLCMVTIFLLSAQNGEESAELSGGLMEKLVKLFGNRFSEDTIRTCAHCLEFTGLSLLIFNAVYATWKQKYTFLIAFSTTVVYAITDEIHQIFVPERAFQFFDLFIDSIGAFLGALAGLIILKIILYKGEKKKWQF